MKKTFLASLALGGLSLCIVGTASAVPTTTYVDGISTYVATGASMGGMSVTAIFSNGGGSETVYWQTINGGSGSGGATGTGWSLNQVGDTFYDPWTLSSTAAAISSIKIDAIAGNAVFDTIYGVNGTPDSANGWPFVVASLASSTVTAVNASYDGEVALKGAAPEGDIFRYLTLDFTSVTGYFAPGDSLAFYADTDNLSAPVPLPASLLLFGTGLTGLAGAGLRRKKGAS